MCHKSFVFCRILDRENIASKIISSPAHLAYHQDIPSGGIPIVWVYFSQVNVTFVTKLNNHIQFHQTLECQVCHQTVKMNSRSFQGRKCVQKEDKIRKNAAKRTRQHARAPFTEGHLPPKVVFHPRSSST